MLEVGQSEGEQKSGKAAGPIIHRRDGVTAAVYGVLLGIASAFFVAAEASRDHLGLVAASASVLVLGLLLAVSERLRWPVVAALGIAILGHAVSGSVEGLERTRALVSISSWVLLILTYGEPSRARWIISGVILLVLAGIHGRAGFSVWDNKLPDGYRPVTLTVLAIDDEAEWAAKIPEDELPAGASIRKETVNRPSGEATIVSYLHVEATAEGGRAEALDRAQELVGRFLELGPPGKHIALQWTALPDGAGGFVRSHILEGESVLANRHVKDAEAIQRDGSAQWEVQITFTKEGSKRFAGFSTRQTGRRTAILFEDVVVAAPMIREPIEGGVVFISLVNATEDEAQLLAGGLTGTLKTKD